MWAQKYKELGDVLEISLEKIEGLLSGDYMLSQRCIGLLLLQDDEEISSIVREKQPQVFEQIKTIIESVKIHYAEPLSYIIALRRQEEANRIISRVVEHLPSEGLNA